MNRTNFSPHSMPAQRCAQSPPQREAAPTEDGRVHTGTPHLRRRFHNIVGKSPSMQKIYALIETIASTRATILIHGESGTGKQLIAHAIHKHNEEERIKPFVEVSCGALTETLLESELFGHVKGAFTGAIRERAGRFKLADGGTIFLDEIDAFSPALQVKLLRVLQEGEFERVGDTATIKVDVRVIASTNQNLPDLIAREKFRKDLYYRLNIISIEVPPLRERKEDIPLLVEEFIAKHNRRANKKILGISPDAMECFLQHAWPGNIRELENAIARAVILSKNPVITPDDFPGTIMCLRGPGNQTGSDGAVGRPVPAPPEAEDGHVRSGARLNLKDALQSPEKNIIIKALQLSRGNRNEAAKILGINRTTLYKKMQKHGLFEKRR